MADVILQNMEYVRIRGASSNFGGCTLFLMDATDEHKVLMFLTCYMVPQPMRVVARDLHNTELFSAIGIEMPIVIVTLGGQVIGSIRMQPDSQTLKLSEVIRDVSQRQLDFNLRVKNMPKSIVALVSNPAGQVVCRIEPFNQTNCVVNVSMSRGELSAHEKALILIAAAKVSLTYYQLQLKLLPYVNFTTNVQRPDGYLPEPPLEAYLEEEALLRDLQFGTVFIRAAGYNKEFELINFDVVNIDTCQVIASMHVNTHATGHVMNGLGQPLFLISNLLTDEGYLIYYPDENPLGCFRDSRFYEKRENKKEVDDGLYVVQREHQSPHLFDMYSTHCRFIATIYTSDECVVLSVRERVLNTDRWKTYMMSFGLRAAFRTYAHHTLPLPQITYTLANEDVDKEYLSL